MIRPPLPVAIVCALGALAALVTAVLFAVDALWAVPPSGGQRALAYAALAVTATALVGLWRMRRWSVVLIAVLFAARIGYGLTGHLTWNLPALAGPTAILLVGLVYFRRMT
jgi:Na+/melibiose symporter-like transporter